MDSIKNNGAVVAGATEKDEFDSEIAGILSIGNTPPTAEGDTDDTSADNAILTAKQDMGNISTGDENQQAQQNAGDVSGADGQQVSQPNRKQENPQPAQAKPRVNQPVACIVHGRFIITEDMLITAWKECYNPDAEDRLIELEAYAELGNGKYSKETKFSMNVTNIGHGGVSNRTMVFEGFLMQTDGDPNEDGGGLSPTDTIGWARSTTPVFLNIVYDRQNQIGRIINYKNSNGLIVLKPTSVSSALNTQPALPPMLAP